LRTSAEIEEENMNGHVRAIVTSVVSLACAFVVVFTATASRGASSNATLRATNGLLAYAAWVGEHPHRHFQIFTVQPDGTHVHQLTHFDDNLSQLVGSGAEWPDWSPDGRKIIFTRHWGDYPGPQSFQLLTMNADGSAMRAVTSRGLDERASYLPDGRILYYRGSSHVWVVANPDGTRIRSTAIHQYWASLCVLSNGNRIALRRNLKVKGAPLSALFVGRLFGGPGSLKRITRYQRMDGIDCSPDGTRILFSSGHDFGVPKSSNVVSVRTDGSGLVRLTRSQGGSVNNDAPAWSPDGTKIVFTRYRNRSKLYVMNADGTAVTQVTHGPEGVGAAAWGSHR
jgi:TolB protein